MRNLVTIVIVLAILGTLSWAFYVYFFEQNPISPVPHQSISTNTPTPKKTPFCLPQNLDAKLTLSPGAGNVWGTFTITNTSQVTCNILGKNVITAQYDPTIKNISVTDQGQSQNSIFSLHPNQTIYSQVHYPNGPQCNGPVNPTNVTFSYQVSPTQTVVFIDNQSGKPQETVQTCSSSTDMTDIQIWNMSATPITQ